MQQQQPGQQRPRQGVQVQVQVQVRRKRLGKGMAQCMLRGGLQHSVDDQPCSPACFCCDLVLQLAAVLCHPAQHVTASARSHHHGLLAAVTAVCLLCRQGRWPAAG